VLYYSSGSISLFSMTFLEKKCEYIRVKINRRQRCWESTATGRSSKKEHNPKVEVLAYSCVLYARTGQGKRDVKNNAIFFIFV
jgi:hypothetical protein